MSIKKILLTKIQSSNVQKHNLIIVIGGDGFMLQTLKRNKNSNKNFYGINSGNYGFLMNKFSPKDIIKNLSKANMVTISPLEMLVKNKNNQIKKSIACLLYTSPSPRDGLLSRMPSSAWKKKHVCGIRRIVY